MQIKSPAIFLLSLALAVTIGGCADSDPGEPFPFPLELDASCSADNDCRLASQNLHCSLCPHGTIDYASDEYLAVNSASFAVYYQAWLDQECPDFARCRKENWRPLESCDEFLRCPHVEPEIINTHMVAGCVMGSCTKVDSRD